MNSLIRSLKELAKSFAFKYTKFGAPNYSYNVEPIQLMTLVKEFERLKLTEGNIVEIGVARGMTTRFMCEHIYKQKFDKSLHYYAIDTYESFTKNDLRYEVEVRGKSFVELQGFAYNNFEIWSQNFSHFKFVKPIKADCSHFDYSMISPIKLSFLDVDLYLPTIQALFKIYDATIHDGVILVDDVEDNSRYDGAYQAYMEFCNQKNIKPLIIGNKCGVIYKT